MKKHLIALAAAFSFLQADLSAQCTLTVSISTNRSTDLCSGDTVVLSGPASGAAWTQKANIGGAGGRDAPVGFSIGNKGYIGTGWNNGTQYSDFWEYDPSTDAWTQKANVGGGGRSYAFGMSIGNKGYVGCGYSHAADLWEYDPVANTWTSKAAFPGGIIQYCSTFSTGSKGYVVGGQYSFASVTNFWEYDPSTNTWAAKASLGSGDLFWPSCFAVNGKGYACGGYSTGSGAYLNTLSEYDAASNTWTPKANLPRAGLDEGAGFSIADKGYVVTGYVDQMGILNELWQYDVAGNQWFQMPNFPATSRVRAAAFNIGNKGYFGSGMDGSYHYRVDFYEFDPGLSYSWSNGGTGSLIKVTTAGTYSLSVSSAATGTCMAIASQTVGVTITPTVSVSGSNTICEGSNTTLTATGATTYTWSANAGGGNTNTVTVSPALTTVYAITGANGQCVNTVQKKVTVNTLPSVTVVPDGPTELCDAGSVVLTAAVQEGTWVQKADFNGGDRSSAVGFSIGNKGYIGLGQPNGFPTPDFWEYDPATDIWTQKANFGGYFRVEAQAFSIGNKGYVGLGVQYSLMTDFWEFDPLANTWTRKADYAGTIRRNASCFSIGTKGYMGVGNDLNNTGSNEFYEYDPATDTWTPKASFPGLARAFAGGFSLGSKGYVCGGTIPAVGVSNELWEYDPVADSWSPKTTFPGGARDGVMAFGLLGKGYVGTGNNGGPLQDVWAYAPSTDSWQPAANFGRGQSYGLVAFAIGNKAYAGTGYDASYTRKADFWEYDPAVTYSWSNGANTQSTSVSSSGDYSVTVTLGTGCSASASQVFNITPSPTLIVSGTNSVCAGSVLTLTASGATTYTWSSNANDAQTADVTLNPASNDTYTVTGANGTCTTVAVKSITVNALPDVEITTNDDVLCAGETTTLSVAGATSYTWSTSETTSDITVSPASGTTYGVEGLSADGCTNMASIFITVNALPAVSITTNDDVLCAGETATLSAGGANFYTWSTGDVTSDIVVSPTAGVTYTVEGTNYNGCTNMAVQSITVNSLPIITAVTNNSLLCAGETATLSATGAVSYTWSTSETASDISINPTTQTTYTVEGMDANGCLNVTTVTQDVSLCTGITQLSNIQTISIYPNPNNGMFTLRSESDMVVNLTNELGQVLQTLKMDSFNDRTITIENVATGMYFITGQSGNQLIKQKIIVTK